MKWVNEIVNTVFIKTFARFFFFFFSPNDSFSKTMKNLNFSWDIQIFVFPSSPLFLPVGHCFTEWSKINRKVYDVINYLNKNSITYFAWYLEKKKSYDIETLSIDRVLNKEDFYGKIIQKICT